MACSRASGSNKKVFYVEDKTNPGWSVVMKMKPRDTYDTGNEAWEDDMETESFHVSHLQMFNGRNNNQHWIRTDIEGTIVDATTSGSNNKTKFMNCDAMNI